jgi:UDP-GlcNAc:undecaprenyl-phosphate GlcNAc-1-phosphate transferase
MGELMVFAVALAVSVVATPVVRRLAVRWRLGDKPNGRKSHAEPIPHLGGIAMFLAIAVAVVAAAVLLRPGAYDWSLAVKAVPALMTVVMLGLVDDMRSLRARQKLVVQIVVAAVLVAVGFRFFTGVWLLDVSSILLVVLSMLFIVGMLSSVNLIDGHDGLAAGVTLIAAVGFAVIGSMIGAPDVATLALAVGGACLGFLFFNFPPGRIYMGDTGSMLLGLLLGLMACAVSMRAHSPNIFAAVCFVLGVPILDTVLAIARRIVLRSPLFAADTLHMHHVLRDAGLSPRRTLLVLYGMQVLFCGLGVAAAANWALPVIVGLGFITVAFIAFLRAMVEMPAARVEAASRPAAPSAIPFQPPFTSGLQERRTSVGR